MLIKSYKGFLDLDETRYVPSDTELHIMWNKSHRMHFSSFIDFKINYKRAIRAAMLLNMRKAKAIDAKTYLEAMPAWGKYADLEYSFKSLIPEVKKSKQWNQF